MKGKMVTHSSWQRSALGDITVSEINPSSERKAETFIYIDLESVFQGKLLSENQISAREAPSRAQRVVHRKDVLFQLVRPYQKNNLFFDKKTERQYVASTGYALIRSKQNAKYLYYFLHTDTFVSAVESYCTGSNYPAITSEKLSQIPVDIPKDTNDQQHIADILSTCDEVIEQTEKTIAKYRDIKAGMLQDLFTRGLDVNGKLRPKPEDAPELYKDSPLGKIPKEWECVQMSTLCDFYSGTGFPERFQGHQQGDYPFVKVRDMNLPGNEIFLISANNWVSGDVATELSAKIIPDNAIAFAKIGAAMLLNRRRLTVRATCFDNNMMAAIPKNINTMLLFYIFLQIDFADFVQTTALPSLNLQKLKKSLYKIPLKELEQKSIVTHIMSLDDKISAEERTLAKYRSVKLGLMKKLLTPPEGALEA